MGMIWSPKGSYLVAWGGFGAHIFDANSLRQSGGAEPIATIFDPNYYIGDCATIFDPNYFGDCAISPDETQRAARLTRSICARWCDFNRRILISYYRILICAIRNIY